MEILELIHCFRNALITTIEFESYKVCKYDGWSELNTFPHGSCAIASNFLGQFLTDHGFNVEVICCNGSFDEIPQVKSHVWLEVNDQYIDLTAYQFVELETRRIIFIPTKERSWLKQYLVFCEIENNANKNRVDINSPFENRSDLYTHIANKADRLSAS